MHSYTAILPECQQIYTTYLNKTAGTDNPESLIADVDKMILKLGAEIRIQSEAGANTVLLEKMQQDFTRIRNDLFVENS